MLSESQLLNLASKRVELSQRLAELVGEVRGSRSHVDANGLDQPIPGGNGALVMSLYADRFPLAGDLSHVQDADQFLASLAAWEHLFGCFLQPVTYTKSDGTPDTVVAAAALYGMVR